MNNNASQCRSKREVAGSIDPTIADSVETSTALSSAPAGADLDLTFGVVRIGGENATEIHSANPVFRPNGHSGGFARLTIKETFSISGNGSGSFTIDRWIAAN